MWAFIHSNRLAAIAALVLGLAIALTAGEGAPTTLAEGFGWGNSASDGPAAQIVADGFGWGAATPPGRP
ncbi:hypothetical protein GA0070560_11631 [Micromonospora halophytica]|uniref:Uncharacterized protein n=1 Tax=Micromonospora halophytica TaxID=47864 RepID=A0A1C5ITR3_9ACTN|nr:hypothetical protein GA0070560_11631 [Micromonospora halophytica]